MSTYSPNNAYVYFQAFSGAVAGLLGQSTPLSSTRGAYTETIAIAVAWAQEVDTKWDSAGNPDLFEYEEILAFSNDLFQVYEPQPEPASITPATYSTSAQALMTVLSDGEAYLAAEGIIPPPIPGGVQSITYVSASAIVGEDASNIAVLASAGTVRLTLPSLASLPNNWILQVQAQGCTQPIVIVPASGTIWDPSMSTFNGTATLSNGSGGAIAWWQLDKENSKFVQIN